MVCTILSFLSIYNRPPLLPHPSCVCLAHSLTRSLAHSLTDLSILVVQASSTRSRFDTEVENKNTQLKQFRDEVEEMMVAIEVRAVAASVSVSVSVSVSSRLVSEPTSVDVPVTVAVTVFVHIVIVAGAF
jgi:hypothetical protein